MLDKIRQPGSARQVEGSIPIFHRYTLGVAGERFFKAMRDQMQLLASPCPKCRDLIFPAKMYCERCFEETSGDWQVLEGPGYVRSYTVLHRSLDEEPLEKAEIVALISWPGARGGIIHRLDEAGPEQLALGLAVEPVWSQERVGAMSDIIHFRPASPHQA